MKRCGPADLKEGMLVSCPHFNNSPKVVVGPAYALAYASRGQARRNEDVMYRIRLADPLTGDAKNFDFPDPADTSFWTIHDDMSTGAVGSEKIPEGFEPCGTFGCTKPRRKSEILCSSCEEDYQNDPDAYK